MSENGTEQFRIIPLGGLGEIGLNMMVFEQDDDLMVIDCGLMFPGDSMPGVDYVIPDFTYILENSSRLRGVVLTHGHEDHIGGLPFLLSQISAPVYGTPLTLGLVRQKLIEYGLESDADLRTVEAGQSFELGPFEIDFIRVSHSIADCVALAVKTAAGYVIHSGDFKLDPTPIDGKRVDLSAFSRYGEMGVTALLSDSTNVEREGYTLSEAEVGKALSDVFREIEGRIIVATFASNIHRIQQVLQMTEKYGRKAVLMGRSMVGNTRIARELGYLSVSDDVLVEPEALKHIPDDKVVLLTTGTQGEMLSGLSRMARDEHKHIKIKPGDTVVMSSRFIPGNERAIDYLINEFYRRGAEVIYEKVSDIHVSGHASQEELKLLLSITKPQYFIPVHGEFRHLVKHSQLAEKMGVPRERVLIAEDGDIITIGDVGGEKLGKIEAGRQVVDGTWVGDSKDMVLQERRKLASDGVLIAVAILDMESGELHGPIRLESHGFLYEEEEEGVLERARKYAEEELMGHPLERRTDKDAFAQDMRASLKRYIKKNIMRFPAIIPVVIET